MSQSSDSDPVEARQGAPVSAGDFSTWLDVTLRSGDSLVTADVPCGDCTACCTSSYFIHIRPDETAALARIPDEYLVEAPGMPSGHVVMGYGENGHCLMLVGGACTIYDDRPQTCRDYDCRIFAATGIELADPAKSLVTEQIRRWAFDTSTDIALVKSEAVLMCSDFLRMQTHNLPPGSVPNNPTHLALLAIALHEVFIDHESGVEQCVVPDIDVVADALTAMMIEARLQR